MTLRSILASVKKPFAVGQIYETIKSLYPEYESKNKNITINNFTFTKPLASSYKSKKKYLKENSILKTFYTEYNKGDMLYIIEVKDDIAYCKNMSLNEEVKNLYYKDEIVKIKYEDIFFGNVKLLKQMKGNRYNKGEINEN